MMTYIARVTLIMLMGVAIVFTMRFADGRANTQQPERVVVRKPWPVEPVKVASVKTKKKEDVEIGRPFAGDDDWLEGFTVTMVNKSHKTVTALTVEMIFRREPGDIRPPLARPLHLGPSPITAEYKDRDPNKVVKAGKTVELSLSPEDYMTLQRDFKETGYAKIKRVELVVTEVGFEDGSVLYSGTLYLQDPAHPDDPTRKVKAPEPPAAQNQKMQYQQNRKDNAANFSFLKTSFTKSSFTLPEVTLAPVCVDRRRRKRFFTD